MKYYLGVDLGGTNIAAGLVDDRMQIVEKDSVKTRLPRSARDICGDIAKLCLELAGRREIGIADIEWIGVGTPGIVWEGVVCVATNLGFENAPVGRLLEEKLGRPVYVRNDADAAAYGEYIAGAGQGRSSLAMVTIGTGIGSGVIFDNRIHSGFNGAAAELGHTVIEYGGLPCPCGNSGCLEMYCSATGLKRMTAEAMAMHPESLMSGISDSAGGISGRTAFEAMRRGDMAAKAVVDRFTDCLAIGVSTVVNLFQPEMVCIGGGVSGEGEALLAPLREQVSKMTFAGREGRRSVIAAARLGNAAGIIGAAMLGKASNEQV